MDGNTSACDSITSTESEIIAEETKAIDKAEIEECVILENEINFETVQHGDEISYKYGDVSSNMTNIEEHDLLLKKAEDVLINEVECVPIENTIVSIDTKENPISNSSVEVQKALDTSINCVDDSLNLTITDNSINQNINSLQSIAESNLTTDIGFEDLSQSSKHNETGPNLEHSQNVVEEDKTSTGNKINKANDDSSLQEIIQSKVDDSTVNNPGITEEQTLEAKEVKIENLVGSNLTTSTEETDRNLEKSTNTCSRQTKDQEDLISNKDIGVISNENDNEEEVVTNNNQLTHDTVNQESNISGMEAKLLEQPETIEDQVQSIHGSLLQKQSAKQDFDQELTDITNKVIEGPKEVVEDVSQSTCTQDNIETSTVIEHININTVTINNDTNEDQINTENIVADGDNIEKQMSSIVQEDLQEVSKVEKTMSIVEAIQRDFDETDSEEIDKPDSVEESQSLEVAQDHVMVGVNISDQLQHGTVTVTDTSGQVYYVQSVEDLIVVENDDLSATLDEPDTLEVTVLSEESVHQQPKSSKVKERPPIPSHILGRNIENPVIDTFRNGKVPPKPRLGVKIPYKNLTSQIVSKDELAKEILDRQKQKYKQSGQTTREILFAKKLTQRLAKKIVPTTTVKTSTATIDKNTQQAINNSDLLAILEGDGEDTKLACTSKANVSSSFENKKDQNSQIKKEKTVSKPVMTKVVERELALKQLKEVSPGFGRRRRHHIENEFPLESSTVTPIIQEEKKNIEKILQPKPDDNIEEAVTKLGEPKSNINKKKALETSSSAEPENSKVTESKTTSVGKFESVEAKLEMKVDGTEDLTTDIVTKSETVNAERQKNELKQPIPSEHAKLEEQVNQKDPVKQSNPHEVLEMLSTDVQAKASTSTVTPVKSTTTTVKTKTDEVHAVISQKDDNPKKIDLTTKPTTSTKVTESNNTLGKVGPILSDVKDDFLERKHISNPPVKTYTRKRKSTEDSSILSNVPDKKPNIAQKDTSIPPTTYITKSSRVIKRKVIWDPDEPSTARSLARVPRPDLVKGEKPLKTEVSPGKIEKKLMMKPLVKIEPIKTPMKSPDIQKSKKRLSEVDRLLMDEGAVNMLYAFKNVDDTIKKKKTTVISLDKAQRELMNKTNELKKDLKTNSDKVSPKSLRRKDSPVPSPSKKIIPATISRKKSKDSNRSSLHSPPASPGMLFLNQAEASRIIRRHSSSSYSSMEGDFDADKKTDTEGQTATPTDSDKVHKKRLASSTAESNKIKKTKRNTDKENVTIDVEKGKTTEETAKNFRKVVEGVTRNESKYTKYKTFSVKEVDHMVQIILLPSFNNEAYLTPEILNELSSIIKELQEDANCTVVVISSSASSFCHGINYKTLLSDKEQSRKTFARKLAQCVTNFLRILAAFTKILVAGVHGDTIGLGVTILPLFDMVIASDTATFSIPNARLGCAAEGGSLLSLPHLMHNVLVSELLYASRKLIAAEALRLGMVTRVLWPDKFHQEMISIVKTISHHSTQFMELTKKQLREHMLLHIESALDKEVDTLVKHWTSSECQKNFGVYG